jgi:hypothetical protein
MFRDERPLFRFAATFDTTAPEAPMEVDGRFRTVAPEPMRSGYLARSCCGCDVIETAISPDCSGKRAFARRDDAAR